MTLDERIKIMEDSGVISAATKDKLHHLRHLFEKMYSIELTEENASACITHFALALERLEKGEDITPISDVIMDDLMDNDDFPSASYITDSVFRHISPLTENERGYIILHVIMVLRNVRAAYDQKVLGE